jgi:hypothetical protein
MIINLGARCGACCRVHAPATLPLMVEVSVATELEAR